jgi:hypothetical protein
MPWKECHVIDERLWFVARLTPRDRLHVATSPGTRPLMASGPPAQVRLSSAASPNVA